MFAEFKIKHNNLHLKTHQWIGKLTSPSNIWNETTNLWIEFQCIHFLTNFFYCHKREFTIYSQTFPWRIKKDTSSTKQSKNSSQLPEVAYVQIRLQTVIISNLFTINSLANYTGPLQTSAYQPFLRLQESRIAPWIPGSNLELINKDCRQ